MRFTASVLLFVSAVIATPAWAEAPPRLHFLEQRLASIGADNPGNLGFAALDLESGELVAIEGDNPFPMASTMKIAVAANYLAQVEHGRRSLDDRIGGRSARSLMEAMIIRSDNYATDLLLRDLGGPKTLQAWLNQVGISGLRVDRNIAQLLRARRDLKDVRDSSTPRAMVTLLKRIDDGSLLQPSSRSYLLGLMGRCMTGKNRIRGLLPYGTQVQNKTGTLNGYTSDVGFITLPNGRRVAVAMFARYGSNRPYTIARAARVIYDGFLYAASATRLTSISPSGWTYQANRNAAPGPLVQAPAQ
jgi:beta-lactamase class A